MIQSTFGPPAGLGLKVKVRSIGPFGPSAVAFQLPLMSAANALKVHSANSRFEYSPLGPPY